MSFLQALFIDLSEFLIITLITNDHHGWSPLYLPIEIFTNTAMTILIMIIIKILMMIVMILMITSVSAHWDILSFDPRLHSSARAKMLNPLPIQRIIIVTMMMMMMMLKMMMMTMIMEKPGHLPIQLIIIVTMMILRRRKMMMMLKRNQAFSFLMMAVVKIFPMIMVA